MNFDYVIIRVYYLFLHNFFFQFFGVHIVSLSVMYLREKWPECLLHASAEKITIEGATLNQSNIAVSYKHFLLTVGLIVFFELLYCVSSFALEKLLCLYRSLFISLCPLFSEFFFLETVCHLHLHLRHYETF